MISCFSRRAKVCVKYRDFVDLINYFASFERFLNLIRRLYRYILVSNKLISPS